MDATTKRTKTVGSLFAGIGGFDIGFEKAGFQTAWQVEINPLCRAVLAERFPRAEQFADVRECGAHNLARVDAICGGFPCQDVSAMGKRRGLAGERTGLFFEVTRILKELRPEWVVLENVVGLLSSEDGRDFQAVLEGLADCGYVGIWRVLDAQYFGVPQRRRRVFMVAGLGKMPPADLLFDAAPMETVLGPAGTRREPRDADTWASYTVLAKQAPGIIGLGCEVLVAEPDGWDQMVERERSAKALGLRSGLDEASFAEVRGAGNAVVPQVAEWVARKLIEA